MSSSRLAIGQGLVALLQAVQNPNTGQPLYQDVKLGAMFDPTTFINNWAEVMHYQGKSGPAGSGGNLIGWRIEDNIAFKITSGVRYDTDSTAATIASLTIQDTLLPLLHSHVQIPSAANPQLAIASIYSLLAEQPDVSRPVKFPNGQVFLLWDVIVLVKQQYNITLTQP